jgi:hypothetical protein
MKYFKSTNDKTHIQWNVESGSGFFTCVSQNDNIESGSTETSKGKTISIAFHSGSINNSPNHMVQQLIIWENRIKNQNFTEIEKEEYDTFLLTACNNLQNNWSI